MAGAQAMKAARHSVTLDDFMTGFLAALAALGVARVSIRGTPFYKAVVAAYEEFESGSESMGLTTTFFLAMNRVHGDSADVREGITKAVQRDLISLDNPVYLDMRLKITADEAEGYFRSLPGGPDLYMAAAQSFLDSYDH